MENAYVAKRAGCVAAYQVEHADVGRAAEVDVPIRIPRRRRPAIRGRRRKACVLARLDILACAPARIVTGLVHLRCLYRAEVFDEIPVRRLLTDLFLDRGLNIPQKFPQLFPGGLVCVRVVIVGNNALP